MRGSMSHKGPNKYRAVELMRYTTRVAEFELCNPVAPISPGSMFLPGSRIDLPIDSSKVVDISSFFLFFFMKI